MKTTRFQLSKHTCLSFRDEIQTLLAVLILSLLIVGCSDKRQDADKAAPDTSSPEPKMSQSVAHSGILPEIDRFLAEHKEFGTPSNVESVPDWAQGKRQRVILTANGKRRSLLFYTKDQKVVTVYEDGPDGRKKVWGEYQKPEEFAPVARETSKSLPAYTVLFSNKKLSGGKFGDILVPSFSRQTPVETRERIFRAIAAKEGIDDVSFYSTEAAYKANVSASFAKSHPNALRNGFLGSLRGGKFTSGETLYP